MSVRLRLLGVPRLEAGGAPTDLPLDRPASLGYYLAQRGDWVRRGELAYLYSPEADEAAAFNNLRKLLHRLKAQGWAETLEAEPARLRLRLPTDVQAFREALDRRDWAGALELYRGRFLEGLAFADLGGYEAWLELERQDLARAWRGALMEQVRSLEAQADWAGAERWLGRLLRAEPLDEEGVQARMRVLRSAGKSGQAREVFERFARDLRGELGVEPLEATRALADSLSAPPAPPTVPRHNLPASSARFVGRGRELEALARHLSNPDCRLLSVVGLGGMGKTRLALELAARQTERFADGAWLVPLAGVSSADLLVSSVASALGLVFSGPSDPKAQLLNYLRGKEALLVLDNFEHLLEGGLLLEELLAQAPGLKLLITSRVALETPSEWLYDLEGLPYPPAQSDQDLDGFDAVRLFVSRAERLSNRFVLTPATLEAVAELTRRVQGMPLALELAATWVRGLSVGEILARLGQGFDLLQTAQPDLPERQRNLQAILEYSWQLLSEPEQLTLARLSVFRGGFTLEAAGRVAGAHLGRLLRFINQALVRRGEDGRYEMHELVRQFAAGKLEGLGRAEETLEGYLGYYLDLTKQASDNLEGAEQVYWKNLLRMEQENLEAALGWGFQHRAGLAVELSVNLSRHWESAGLLRVGSLWLDQAIACSQTSPIALRAKLRLKRWAIARELGDLETVDALSDIVAELCGQSGDSALEAERLNIVGLIATQRRDFEEARRIFQQGLHLAEEAGISRVQNYIYLNLGHLETMQGDFEQSLGYLGRSLEIARERKDLRLEMITLSNMAAVALYQGDYPKSVELSEQALNLAKLVHDRSFEVVIQGNLGYARWQTGDFAQGERFYREHVVLLLEQGNIPFFAENAFELSKFWSHLGFAEDAVILWGAAEQVRTSQGYPIFDGYQQIQGKVFGSVEDSRREELVALGKNKSPQELTQFLKSAARA